MTDDGKGCFECNIVCNIPSKFFIIWFVWNIIIIWFVINIIYIKCIDFLFLVPASCLIFLRFEQFE